MSTETREQSIASVITNDWRRPVEHTCPGQLRDQLAGLGIDAEVGTDPTPSSPYATAPFVCPHGVALYPLPTAGQYATWEAEETA